MAKVKRSNSSLSLVDGFVLRYHKHAFPGHSGPGVHNLAMLQ